MNSPAPVAPSFHPARIAGVCALAALLLFFACHLEAPSEADGSFSFPTLKGKIGEADHVTIILQDSTGNTLNVLFDGPVDSTTSFDGLKAPGYEGEKVYIHIVARKGEEVVYKTTRSYDPARGGDLERNVEVAPPVKAHDSLRLQPDTLTLALLGPSGRFTVRFLPATAAHAIAWSTPDPSLLDVAPDGRLTARAEGLARVIAASNTAPKVVDTAWVRIVAAVPVDSVRFERRFLDLFVQDAAESLHVRVFPPLAPPGIAFQVGDTSRVHLAGGLLQGLAEGETWVTVKSVASPHLRDSIPVTVFPPGQVDSVRLAMDSLRLYLHGESLRLEARLFPASLTPRFAWKSEDETVARVDADGRVLPVGPGETRIVVRARADSAKRDQALVLVKRDVPRLEVGGDTVVARGTVLTYIPRVTQEYGLVTQFKWDLDGEGGFEDSSATPPSELNHLYAEARTYAVRFYVRDSEGNDTVHFRRVKAVDGRVVQILSPKNGSSTKEETIPVTWKVDDETLTTTERLHAGANTIVRSAQDSARNLYADTVLVYLDQAAPPRPVVKGPTGPVNTLTPSWSWASGDTSRVPGAGAGIYRFRLDDPDLTAAVSTTDTFFTAPTNLRAGTHTLFVQERDEAGNWSPSGSHAVVIDTTAPPAPVLSVSPESPTNNPRPAWSWSGGAGDSLRYYRFKLDNDDFRTGARDTLGTGFRPGWDLPEGVRTLYVQQRDSAGNWSPTGSLAVTLDRTPPPAPSVAVGPAPLTNDATPTWTWTTPTAGAALFRWRLDSADLTSGAMEGESKAYTPGAPLAEGLHTLYVQERDAAGNWSASDSQSIRIDLTPPSPPRIDSTPYSPLNSLRPTWTWRSGTGGAKVFRARVDTTNLIGATERMDSLFMPETNLAEGSHVLYVQERDSAGNWSNSTSRSLVVSINGQIGNASISNGEVDQVSLILDDSDAPIIAYSDKSLGKRVCVKKYHAGTWVDLGTPQLDSGSDVSLAKGSRGSILLAYSDHSKEGRATVKSFDGDAWLFVGGPGFTRDGVGKMRIATGPAGEPVLFSYSYDGEIVVMRFTGFGWNIIGEREDFPPTRPIYFAVGFGMSRNGIPYVATVDGSYASVFRHINEKWEKVGPTFPAGMYDISFGYTDMDEPIVAYGSNQENDTVNARIFTGSSWELVGNGAGTNGLVGHEGLVIGGGNKTYIAFPRKSPFGSLSVFNLSVNSAEWKEMSVPGYLLGSTERGSLSLALSSQGVPHIAFINAALGNRVTVIRASFSEHK